MTRPQSWQRSSFRSGVLAAMLALPLAMFINAAAPRPRLDASAKAGQSLFQQDCSICHYPDQTTTKIGPGLKGLFKSKVMPFSHLPFSETQVIHQIETGNAQAKPLPMPSFKDKLSSKQLQDLVAYLKAL